MIRRLTEEWSIDLDGSFASRVVDGNLQLVSAGPPVRTIWVAVWSPPEHLSPEDLLRDIRGDQNPSPDARWDEAGSDGEVRTGTWYSEQVGPRLQWGLYGYTVRRGSYVQAAFLCDDPDDLSWALEAWRSLRFRPQ